MQATPIRIFLILFILFLANPSSLLAAPESRTALVIGNSAYSSGPLKNPVNDATDMAAALKQAGFSVTLKKDANLREMMEAIEEFGNTLKKGGVGLFYYAGHGVQVSGVNYLLPIGAHINKEGDVRYEAVDAGRILAEMENANNGLNIVLLDACRDNPFGRTFRSASRGLAIVTNAPSDTFISYSTGAGQVARDGTGKNSPYTSAVLQYMQEPGVPITDVFIKVRQKLRKETGQVPWELSSLEGKFYFRPGAVTETKMATTAPSVDYTVEQRKIDEEKDKLRKEKELLAQQESLAEERRRLEEKKKQIATFKPPSTSSANEIKREGRFIAYSDGTVLDTQTNLMWAARDNGHNINWLNAKSYCENSRVGGYTDWRMPTQNELAGLYDISMVYMTNCGHEAHLTGLIHLTCTAPWASETRGSNAAIFGFDPGISYWSSQSRDKGTRALPVRSVK